MYRVFVVLVGVLVATNAFGKDPEYYVKKGTWQETLQASREARARVFQRARHHE